VPVYLTSPMATWRSGDHSQPGRPRRVAMPTNQEVHRYLTTTFRSNLPALVEAGAIHRTGMRRTSGRTVVLALQVSRARCYA
jgi:hypothetical protein